jgi:hypothetical protein
MEVSSFFQSSFISRFDPEFEDRIYDINVLSMPIETPRENISSDYSIVKKKEHVFEVFDTKYQYEEAFEAIILNDRYNTLWMSDTPQERMMMHANAKKAKGKTLVGGLGLGIYPQYAQKSRVGNAERFVIVEKSKEVIELIKPVLKKSMKVPYQIINDSIECYLDNTKEKFDEIFIDTWATLEPKMLPMINGLKNLALLHLSWGGTIHLWGYKWIIDMYKSACVELVRMDNRKKEWIIESLRRIDEKSAELLFEIESKYHGYIEKNMEKIEKEIIEIGERTN